MTTVGLVLTANVERQVAPANRARTSLAVASLDASTGFSIKDGGSGVSLLNGLPVPPNGVIGYRIPEDDPTSSFFAISSATINIVVQEQMGVKPIPVRVV